MSTCSSGDSTLYRALLSIVSISCFTIPLMAGVYGNDDRELVSSATNAHVAEWSRAVAAQLRVPPVNVDSSWAKVEWKTLKDHIGLCEDQRFAEQPTFSRCTGFFIGEDLLVTAGHCVNTLEECSRRVWAFTDRREWLGDLLVIPQEDIYTCIELVHFKKNPISENDSAMIRLDRAVTNRTPLNYRSSGKVSENDSMTVIGHPSGLPLTVASRGQVLENDNPFLFKTDSDVFYGNSGSPIINERTGKVEGIVTNGDRDYAWNKERSCYEYHICDTENCKRESMVRITVIPQLAPGMTPEEPIFRPDRPIRL